MKEVRILIKELRSYPDNAFVEVQPETGELKPGLVVRDLLGVEYGFIEIGGEKGIVVK